MVNEMFLQSVGQFQPICQGCGTKIKYGVTTKYSDKDESHKCLNCGCLIK